MVWVASAHQPMVWLIKATGRVRHMRSYPLKNPYTLADKIYVTFVCKFGWLNHPMREVLARR